MKPKEPASRAVKMGTLKIKVKNGEGFESGKHMIRLMIENTRQKEVTRLSSGKNPEWNELKEIPLYKAAEAATPKLIVESVDAAGEKILHRMEVNISTLSQST